MAKPVAAIMTTRRFNRATLLRSTALQAVVGLVMVAPAVAQPAPNARPQGGQVVAGSASIGTTANATNVTQSTNRAAIDWRSFDVGSNQSVNFQQPSAAAVTLNRVTGGDPSAIAGKISANGQIILTNPSGVTFYQGAQVNAQSVVVSAAGITNQNFMAGKMVFDQAANPNARIDNRGTITVKQAGLAALVAPSVANSGVINARMGQVVLAGAAAHTLDMYGDGLVAIDVTKQVTQAPVGPDGKMVTALVTNSGTIRADGGVVQLTASAADGVVQTLVRAGGKIQANSVGNQTGRIEIAGTGGSVVVEGRIAADGKAPGTVGGQVMVAGSDTTTLTATAHVTASGKAGGGTIALGTTLARARGTGPAPTGTSARTLIASGARVSADATTAGNGGRVTVLSTQQTSVAGAVTARGGKAGGDGGTIELSGETGFTLTGSADTSAPRGALGTIVLDPYDLTISATAPVGVTANPGLVAGDPSLAYNTPNTGTNAYVTPAQIQALTGNVHLETLHNLTVADSVSYTGGNLTLEAGSSLTVNALTTTNTPLTLHASGVLTLAAGSSGIPGYDPTGTLSIQGAISSGSSMVLSAGLGGIAIGGSVASGTNLSVATTGALTQTATSSVTATDLSGTAGSVSLTSRNNNIAGVATQDAKFITNGDFSLASPSLTIGFSTPTPGGGLSVPNGHTITLAVDSLAVVVNSYAAAIAAPGGTLAITPFTIGGATLLTTTAPASPPGGLVVTAGILGQTTETTLQLGAVAGSPVGLPTGTITIGSGAETVDLRGIGFGAVGPTTIAFQSAGTVMQDPGGALKIGATAGANAGVLTGQAGTLSLVGANNVIGTLAGFSTTAGDLAFTTSSGLTVPAGTLVSGNGMANAVTLSSAAQVPGAFETGNRPVGMLILGSITGKGVSLSGVPGTGTLTSENYGISEVDPTSMPSVAPGSITASTLIGRAGFATLYGPNAVQQLGDFASYEELSVTNATLPLSIIGNLSSQIYAVALGGAGISQTTGSSIVAPQFDATSSADTILTSTNNRIGSIGYITQSAGNFTLVNGSPVGTNPTAAVPLLFGANYGTVNAAHGSLTFVSDQVGLVPTPAGGTTLAAPMGSVSFAPFTAGRRIELIGTSAAADSASLSISSTLLNYVSALRLDVGDGNTTGTINIGNPGETIDLVGHAGTLQLRTTGSVTQGVNPSVTGGVASLDVNNLTGSVGSITLATPANGTPANQISEIGFGDGIAGEVDGLQATGSITVQSASNLSVANVVTGNATSGTVTLGTSGSMTVLATNLSAQTVTLTASGTLMGSAGTLTQTAGSISAGGTLTLTSSGLTSQTGGTISAATLAGTTGSLTLGQSGNVIQAVSGAISGDVTLTNSVGLSIGDVNFMGDTTLNVLLGNLTFTGAPSFGSLALNVPAGSVTTAEGGTVSTAGLSGSAASVDLGSASILTLGDFTAAGAFSINNFGPLNLGGAIRAATITIISTEQMGEGGPIPSPIIQNGGSLSAGTISIQSSDGFTQSSGSMASTGALSISNTGALTLNGSLSAVDLSLVATTNGGNVGTISQTGGTITAGTLSGSSAGTTSLGSAGNAVGTLSGFSSAGGFSLNDGQALAVTGPVMDSTSVAIATTGTLSLGGTVTTGALSLTATGAITQPGGSIVASSLSGSAGGVSLTQRGNQIGTLGGFTSTADFALTDGTAVMLSDTVSTPSGRTLTLVDDAPTFGPNGLLSAPGGTVVLSEYTMGNGITVGGGSSLVMGYLVSAATLTIGTATGGPVGITGALNLSAVSVLDLESAGAISETGAGAIRVNTLTGHGASATLGGGNLIRTLGGFVTTTGLLLSDSQELAVTGPVTDGQSVSLTAVGGISVSGTVTAPVVMLTATSDGGVPGGINQSAGVITASTSLTLTATGDVGQTGGTIVAGTLSGSAGGAASLGSLGNTVTTLGGFATTGDFLLYDDRSLTVSAPVDPNTVTLSVVGSLTLNSSVTGGTVDLIATGPIIEGTGGQVIAGTLIGSANAASLGGTNLVGTLGSFTTVAGLALADAEALTVAGPVTDGQSIALSVTGSLGLSGSVTAPGVTLVSNSGPSMPGGIYQTGGAVTGSTTLTLTSSGVIGQTGGTVTAGTLNGSSAGATSLGQAGNAVATLGGFSSAGGFSLNDGQALAVTGPVTDGTSVAIATPGALSLGGTVTTGALTLTTGGAITQPGGSLIATSLTGSAGGVSLTQRGNQVGTLGGFTSTVDFALTDGTAVAVSGAVSAGSGRTVTLLDDAPSFGSGGSLSAPGGTVALAEYTAGKGITVGGGNGLTGTPPVTATTLELGIATGGPVTIAGAFNLSTVSVLDLESAGAISETGAGAIRIGTLTGHGASATLGGGNQVGTLGGLATTTGLSLSNAQGLVVAGPVTDGQSIALNVAGGLTVSGNVTAPVVALTASGISQTGGTITASTSLTLTATGDVGQTGGTIVAGTLSGSAGGAASLGSLGNTVTTLGGFATTGDFLLYDDRSLTVSAPVDPNTVTLSVVGSLTLNSSVTGGTVDLIATGPIIEGTGGQVIAGTLIGSANAASLGGTNLVGTLGSFTTVAGLALADAEALTVAGPVTDGQSIALSVTGSLGLSGSVTAPGVTLVSNSGPSMPGGIYQTGGAVTGSTTLTLTSSGVIGQTGGTVTAGTLNGSSAGATSLGQAGNAVATLGGFSSAGGFSLNDGQALAVTGPVTDGTSVAIATPGALSLGGTVTTGALTLTTGGAITQPGGSLIATSLTGSAGGVSLTQRGNQVGTLGGFTSTVDFALTDGTAVAVSGAVSAGSGRTVTLLDDAPSFGSGGSLSAPGGTVALAEYTAGKGITVGGGNGLTGTPPVTATTLELGIATGGPVTIAGAFNLSTVSVLDLESAGAISETGAGAIRIGTLTGHGASATLGGGNQVGTLGGLATTTGLSLSNAQGLVVAGPVTDGQSIALNVAGGLTVSGNVTAPVVALTASGISQTGGTITASTSLTLTATGDVGQTGGTIVAGTLSGSAGGAASLGSLGNTVTTLGGFATTGDFLLYDDRSLTVSAPVDPNTVTLSVVGSLTLNSSVTGGTVDLIATGPIIEGTGGQVIAGTLIGSANAASLGGTNLVGTLGSFTTVAGLALADAEALTVAGPVTDGQSIALSVTGSLGLSGSVTAPGVTLVSNSGPSMPGGIYQTGGAVTGSTTLTLTSSGVIGQTGGTITAGTLNGSSAGATSLGQAGNAVATLGGFSSAGGFSLSDGQSLAVTGPVMDGTSVAIATPGALSLGGTVTTGALTLTTGGAITQPGGSLIATSLTGSAGGVSLTQRGNQVGTLGGFTSTVDFALTDGTAVAVSGAVSAGSGRTVTLLDDAPSFGSSGSLSAPGGTVALAEYTAGKGITVGGGNGLTGTPPVTATTLELGIATGGPVTIAGAFNLSTVSVLDLESAGAISETGAGAIRIGTLTGHGASATLGGGNQVGTLGGFATTTGLSLSNAQGLVVAGPVTDGQSIALNVAGGLTVSGNVTAPVVALTASGISQTGGTITANTSTTLTSSGAIGQTGGMIATGSLTGTSAGVTSLGNPGNAIGTLGSFATKGGFSLTDGQSLTVAGPVSDGTSVAIATAGALSLAGTVTTGALTLTTGGAITQPGGGLTATSLTGSAGSAALTQGGNQLGTLNGFTTSTGFTLVNGQPLSVAGSVTDKQSISLSATGPLTLAGTISAPAVALVSTDGPGAPGAINQTGGIVNGTGSVTLSSSGVISQTGGTIAAGTLAGSSVSTTNLASAGNAVTTLGRFSSVGGFSLVDGTPLQVTGPVTDSTGVGLAAFGTLALNGTVQTGAFRLTSGIVTQPGGSVTASSLSGNVQSLALTQQGNQIGTLANFSTVADFALTDSVALTVSGAVSAGQGRTLTLVDDAPTFGLGGSLSAPGGTVALSEYTAGKGLTIAGGGSLTGTPPVTATTLVVGSSTAGPITIAGAFNLSTVSVLDLESASAIGETGSGAIRVGTLVGHGASATLAGANQIGTLGSFTTAGTLGLTNAQGLAVTGPVTASALSLAVTGDLALSGAIVAPASVSLVASGAITQSGGGIATASLSGSANSASLGSTGNAVTTLAGFTTKGDFTLFDGTSLTVSAPVDPITVTLSVFGSLTLNSSVTGDAVVLTASGPIIEGAGGQLVATTLSGSANAVALNGQNRIGTLGNFQTTGLFSLNDNQPLAVTGSVVAGQPVTIGSLGDLTLSGSIAAPVVALTANAGAITESAGTIMASSAAGLNAGGGISQTGGSIVVGGSGNYGTLTLMAGGPVTQAGTISSGGLAIITAGSLTQTGGTLSASGFSGSAGGAISLGVGGTATILGIGNLSSPSGIRLVDAGPLVLGGTLASPNVAVVATGSLTLNGGMILTDGLPLSQQRSAAPNLPGSYFQVVPGSAGTATINQVGVTTVASYSGGLPTVRFDLPASGGSLRFSALNADSSNVVLSLGSGNGTGTIDATSLTVLGSGGSGEFGGQVSGRTDFTAAEISQISPIVSNAYTLNGCAIGAESCSSQTTLLSTLTAALTASSVIRPDILTLDVLDLSVTRDRDDPTLLLPNISDRDY